MRTFLLVAVLVGLPVQAQAQAGTLFWGGNKLVELMHEAEKLSAAALSATVCECRGDRYSGSVGSNATSIESNATRNRE